MGDCVESLAEVKVDNIDGSPFIYPILCGVSFLMLILLDRKYLPTYIVCCILIVLIK